MAFTTFESMPFLALNRRIVTTVLIGILVALSTLFIVPISERFHGGPWRAHHFRPGPPPDVHQAPGRGPTPGEFLRHHNEPIPPQNSYVGDYSRWGHHGNAEAWRSHHPQAADLDRPDAIPPLKFRPFQPPVSSYHEPSEYLKQTLVADYAGPLSERVFFMLKTGATVMWERLPLHIATTLTRVKNFAFYSDLASSINGYEVIDILKDMPEHVLESSQLEMYRILRDFHEQGLGGEVHDLDFNNKGWELDKFKNVPMLAHAYETSPESEWFIFIDDDSYLFWNNVELALSNMNHSEPHYLGSLAYMGANLKGEEVRDFGHGGSGVIISKGAMDLVFGPGAQRTKQDLINYYSDMTLSYCCGDMMVAVMLFEEAGIRISAHDPHWPWRRLQGEPSNAIRWRKDMWCEPLLSFHHAGGREIEHLWEYERMKEKDKYITHADLYHDWMQPYIVEERPFWMLWEFDIDGHHHFSPEDTIEDGNVTYVPVESAQNCKKACQHDENCLAWYHVEGFCGLHKYLFRPGVPSTPLHHNWPGTTPTTGWMIDRIRVWRSEASCDELRDDDLFPEGWYVRAKEAEKERLSAKIGNPDGPNKGSQ